MNIKGVSSLYRLNLISYFARLTRDGAPLDDFANSALRNVLLVQKRRENGYRKDDSSVYRFKPGPELDANVVTAAAWIFIAGDHLVRRMDSGPYTIKVEDWYFWRKRLQEIRDLEGVSEETRQLAGRVAAVMEL